MRWAFSSTLAALVAATAAQSQGALHGRVVSDSTRRPIEGVELVADSFNRAARTDLTGQFILDRLPEGWLTLRIRAVGYKPESLRAKIRSGDTIDVDFSLTPAPVQLPTVDVRAPSTAPVSGKLEEFERRRKLGIGSFLARAELAKWEAYPLSTPLRQAGNFRLVPRKQGCGGGYALASGHGSGQGAGSDSKNACAQAFQACYVAIYLDGALVWTPGMDDPPDIDQYAARDLQAIELYRGAGELPAELQQTGTACGAVVLWSRTGEAETAPRSPRPAA
jgi:hypothetical protein